ncbi:MAG: hypothetical protein ABI140_03355 [Jatrophihabitantaceae bacterium]
MTRRAWLPVLIIAGLGLTGCASGTSSASKPALSTAGAGESMAGMSMAPAGSAANSASKPTATALMICGDDIKGKVTQVLKLGASPATRSSFANELYTCTYLLPMGPLVLSVQHSESKAAAGHYFDTLRTKLAPAETLDGLGEHAYGTSTGIAVVVKDNETLKVDATGLPSVFGADRQKRTDLAYEIASDVLGCWTGDE